MAATAVGFSLSTSLQGLKHCIRSKYWASSSDPLLKVVSSRVLLQAGLVSQTHAPDQAFGIGPISQTGRIPRITAAVDQEEAAPPAEGVEEEVSGGEGDEADEASAPTAPVVNTKLYFGNLPYHCDSAQLAGIIQEYGSPELVEVYIYTKSLYSFAVKI